MSLRDSSELYARGFWSPHRAICPEKAQSVLSLLPAHSRSCASGGGEPARLAASSSASACNQAGYSRLAAGIAALRPGVTPPPLHRYCRTVRCIVVRLAATSLADVSVDRWSCSCSTHSFFYSFLAASASDGACEHTESIGMALPCEWVRE